MSNSIQTSLSAAVRAILRPLVRVLLRNGVSYGSFADLAKQVYVEVAFSEFAPQGKKQTVSRVSALTGLTRKETKRLSEADSDVSQDSEQRYNRAVRVISGWLHDSQFHDARGQPADLPVEGEHASFSQLVKRYSGDMTVQSMLQLLKQAATVEQREDRVVLLQHAYVPSNDDAETLRILGVDSAELIATIDHNLVSAPEQRRFQRKVAYTGMDAAAVARFRLLSAQRNQQLLEEYDQWLSQRAAEQHDSGTCYVSVGIYYYEDDLTTRESHS